MQCSGAGRVMRCMTRVHELEDVRKESDDEEGELGKACPYHTARTLLP